MAAAAPPEISPAELIDEVTNMFRENDDAELTRAVGSLGHEIVRECAKQQAHLKELIAKMTEKVASDRSYSERAQSPSHYEKTMEELTAKQSHVAEHEGALRERLGNVQKQEEEMEEKRAALLKRKEHIDAMGSQEQPRASQMLSLFANITRIKWDYAADCKGFVILEQEVRPFNIDTAARSRAQVADELWAAIGSDWVRA